MREFAQLHYSAGMEEVNRISLCVEENDPLRKLLEAVARHDQQALAALYERSIDKVYTLAYRITQSHETAEEVVNDVYLQVWHNVHTYDASRASVAGWLCVICRSRALDAVRRNQSNVANRIDEGCRIDPLQDERQLHDLLVVMERNAVVHTALVQLEQTPRQLLALAFFKGYTHQQLADFTGMPLGTVKATLRRAVAKLQQYLAAQRQNFGWIDEQT